MFRVYLGLLPATIAETVTKRDHRTVSVVLGGLTTKPGNFASAVQIKMESMRTISGG